MNTQELEGIQTRVREHTGLIYRADLDALLKAGAENIRLADELNGAKQDAQMSWGCIDTIRETLQSYLGEEMMRRTAPMFYPEAIRAVISRAQRGEYLVAESATAETPAV